MMGEGNDDHAAGAFDYDDDESMYPRLEYVERRIERRIERRLQYSHRRLLDAAELLTDAAGEFLAVHAGR